MIGFGDHINNLTRWKFDDRIKEMIKFTGFAQLLGIHENISHNPALLESFLELYDSETTCFEFNNFKIFFGLEDILFITGLPIDGQPVICDETPPKKLLEEYLGMEVTEMHGGHISLSKLREKFENVPDDANEETLARHARALLLYIIGSTIFPTSSGSRVSVCYLSFLTDIGNVSSYAWGAALLAHLHTSLAKFIKDKRRPDINQRRLAGHTFSLMIAMLERIPMLWAYIINTCPVLLPQRFPLIQQWSNLIYVKSKDTFHKTSKAQFLEILNSITEDQVVWQPYGRLPTNYLPEDLRAHIDLCLSCTTLISMEKMILHMPNIGRRQYVLEPIETHIPELNLDKPLSRNGHRCKAWLKVPTYQTYIQIWEQRRARVIGTYHFGERPSYPADMVVIREEQESVSEEGLGQGHVNVDPVGEASGHVEASQEERRAPQPQEYVENVVTTTPRRPRIRKSVDRYGSWTR